MSAHEISLFDFAAAMAAHYDYSNLSPPAAFAVRDWINDMCAAAQARWMGGTNNAIVVAEYCEKLPWVIEGANIRAARGGV